MKRLFIETKYEGKLTLPKELIEQLPQKIVLAMPVQFLDFVDSIKEQLVGKEVTLFKSKHGIYTFLEYKIQNNNELIFGSGR